jgi:hypothetical protein
MEGVLIVYLAIVIAFCVASWKVFTKAGHPGWAIFVPIYNLIVMLKIAGKPGWWVIGMLIPLVNIAVAIIMNLEIAKRFGKGTGFAVGLILLTPIFWLILGFGDSEYSEPSPVVAA